MKRNCLLLLNLMVISQLGGFTQLESSEIKRGARSPLASAIYWNDTQQVRLLISRGEDVHETTESGETLLHQAVRQCGADIVLLLLEAGVDVNAQVKFDHATALHYAISKRAPSRYSNEDPSLEMLTIVELLLKAGIDVNAKLMNLYSGSALQVAADRNYTLIVLMLLRYGADVNSVSGGGISALHVVARNGNTKLLRILLRASANVNIFSNLTCRTPLFEAILSDCVEVVQLLVDAGANVNAEGPQGHRPIHYAAWKGTISIVRTLLDAGADMELCSDRGMTPAAYAKRQGHQEVSLLLEKLRASS